MAGQSSPANKSQLLPFMAGLYANAAQPVSWAAFRLIIGGHLMVSGWPKILDPFAQAAFVENIGFYPGWLFSTALAVLQFVGGLLICLGLLTRPAALANAVMLLITLWFHVSHPYGERFLTGEGLTFLAKASHYLTAAGQERLLLDGGRAFLLEVQEKAVFNSTFWSAGAGLIAVFGGGPISIDRLVIRRESGCRTSSAADPRQRPNTSQADRAADSDDFQPSVTNPSLLDQ